MNPDPKVIKLFSCSTQLSTKFQLKKFLALSLSDVGFIMLINVEMTTIVGILTFMSRINFMLSRVEYEKSFITLGPDQTASKGAVRSGSILFAIKSTKVLQWMTFVENDRKKFNSYNPSVLFVGHRQIMQTQIRCHKT